MPCATSSCLPLFPVMQLSFSAFLAILFLQSGLDKVLDWKGNKAYLTDHFAKSPLRGTMPLLLPVITLVELAAGLFSAAGAVAVLLGRGPCLGGIGATCAVAALLMLFFGQRVAKDYAGAAALVPYFLVATAALYFFMHGCGA
mgnify:CR=1 FL=1|jgi:uncharacterized membrane protein YphA (DoxX/SURF4 family)